ncbi:MAG: CsoR family transcriptional regulator, copper-sensing transcriptional repressor [Patescibacteria group bacterium]|jgi:DNA-binding FrmR family transcriptional regulator|nr:CsoR family transcriptional regulator, copper-sensing transcriptional repressor [Patescibacteria group bacterium]
MENKDRIVIALQKAKSSIEKLIIRIERGDSECFPIIQQTLSVIGLLKSANVLMLESHMEQKIGKHGNARHLKSLQMEILKIIKISQNK